MSMNATTTVGQLAAERPLATRVFMWYGIDFCCGGARPLAEVCREKGLDAERVLEEIQKELEGPAVSTVRWDEAPLDALIDHILLDYHRPLHAELPRLESMARKVLEAHRDKDPERLSEILSVYLGLEAELDQHMAKEEQILFPLIRMGHGAMANGPISVMQDEHDSAGEALRRLRDLTNDYEVPEGACNTWKSLWYGLSALETSLQQHIHLENNILFPRALAG